MIECRSDNFENGIGRVYEVIHKHRHRFRASKMIRGVCIEVIRVAVSRVDGDEYVTAQFNGTVDFVSRNNLSVRGVTGPKYL